MNKDETKEKREGFTPGPWKVKYDKQGYPYVGVESDPHTYQGTVATVEQRKDARLIASAPAMYDMLVKISQGNGYDTLTLAMEARELLAKADGRVEG